MDPKPPEPEPRDDELDIVIRTSSVVAALVAVNDLLGRLDQDDPVAVELRYISGKLADALQRRETPN